MALISNDPSWWPIINSYLTYNYWSVAGGLVVVYDWGLTFGQETELIWKQRWSLMTVLYLVIRYIGIPYSIIVTLLSMTFVSMTDAGCNMMDYLTNVTYMVVTAVLGVIMIARLHAMYQLRIILIFLVIIFLAVNIAYVVIVSIVLRDIVAEELILSGTHMCGYEYEGDAQLLFSMFWMLYTLWEVLALFLSVWSAVKHFRDLRRIGSSSGSTIKDGFRVLIKSHVLYFASFVGVSCLQLALLSPGLENSYSKGASILAGAFEIVVGVQMFVLGPRLILSVRAYHAKEISIDSLAFQEYVYVPTSSIV